MKLTIFYPQNWFSTQSSVENPQIKMFPEFVHEINFLDRNNYKIENGQIVWEMEIAK